MPSLTDQLLLIEYKSIIKIYWEGRKGYQKAIDEWDPPKAQYWRDRMEVADKKAEVIVGMDKLVERLTGGTQND